MCSFSIWLFRAFSAFLVFLLALPLSAASLEDLLYPDKLAEAVKAKDAQKPALAAYAQRLNQMVSDYQWERGRKTCEAVLWQGRAPDIRELHELRKTARKAVDAILDTIKAELDSKQAKRIDKLLKGKDNILDIPISDLPFAHVNNTPLFSRFRNNGEAYKISLPGAPDPDSSWSYADLLSLWTVRAYIPNPRQLDEISQEPGMSKYPDMGIRELPTSVKARIVKSPLLLAATLMVPDLNQTECNLLWDHYPHETDSREDVWTRYKEQNRHDDAILIRLKMSTPYSERYLKPERWIIYLEDNEGTGYEPVQIVEEAVRPIETIEISLPGREAEVTDVFGNYYPYIPGQKELIYLEAPSKVKYTGTEKLVKLFFPLKNFMGKSVVTEKTEHLKLVVQSREEEFSRTELVWELKRSKPRKP